MEKYKANRNQDAMQGEQPEKSKSEQKQESTEKAVDLAATAALDAYTGGTFSKAKNVASKVPVVGKKVNDTWNKAVGGVSKAVSKTPVGDAAKTLDDSGITDVAKKGYDAYSGAKFGGNSSGGAGGSLGGKAPSNKTPNKGNTPNNGTQGNQGNASSQNTGSNQANVSGNNKSGSIFSSGSGMFTDNIMPGFKMNKIAIIAGGSFIFIIIMVIFGYMGQKDMQNMAITNLTVFSESSAGGLNCTNEQIDEMIVYIGGNVVNDMASAVSSNANFISYVNGYNDFKNNTLSSIETQLSNMQKGVVVLSFDVYDLTNFDSYVVDYKDLINKYPKLNFYVLSLGQVIDGNSYGITNDIINEYNSKIINNFGDIYLDFNSYIGGNFSSNDGISYDISTYNNIHSYVVSSVVSSEEIICNGGSIETMTDEQLRGATATILGAGETIESKIGSDDLASWNTALVNDVKNAGVGNGLAPAIAAFGLIQGAMNRGFIIPYFSGGGHNPISTGVDGSWGESSNAVVNGVTTNVPKGIDDTGLIAWAIKNGGCNSFSHKDLNELKLLGEEISPMETVPGDLIVTDKYAMMVLYNDGFNVIVAEANKDYGVVFNEYYHEVVRNYDIISMSDYYRSC